MSESPFEMVGKIVTVDEPVCGYHKIEFIGHALDRMKDWELTEEDALRVLRSPDVTGLQTIPGRERFRRHKTARFSVDVVFERKDDLLRVFTVIKITLN